MATEAEIQRGIVKYLKRHACVVYTTSQGYRPGGGTRVTAGLPDLLVIHSPGAWTFAEVKTPAGRMNHDQDVFALNAETARIPWELWRSVDDAVAWAKAVGIVA